jgi:arylamine N-acetyltransferase
MFVTRWRTYKSIAYNRLLPKEDFDQEMREERVYVDETKAKQKKEHTQRKRNGENVGEYKEEAKEYERVLSSLILWSVSPDDNSNEWLNLFDVEHFSTAYKERNEFREVLNTND